MMWMMRGRDGKRNEASEMRFVRHVDRARLFDKERNYSLRQKLETFEQIWPKGTGLITFKEFKIKVM
jgi:hypothetical protein